MNVCFAYVTDERGFDLTVHSATSLCFSQKKPVDIHFFCYKFKPAIGSHFHDLFAQHDTRISFHEIQDSAAENHPTCGHVTTPSLLKLRAVERLVDKYNIVVYLDSDILAFKPLDFAGLAVGDHPVGAVIDMDLSPTGALRNTTWSTANGTEDVGDYFNSGVMAFFTDNWRGDEFRNRYLNALDQHDVKCSYKLSCTSIDQCALNMTFDKKWLHLPIDYNMQAGAKFTRFWQSATIRHYCGTRKFKPLVPFRSDGKDFIYVNKIEGSENSSSRLSSLVFHMLFLINAARNYRSSLPMRQFLDALKNGA